MRRTLLTLLLISVAAAAQSQPFERMRTPSGGYAICAHCTAPSNITSMATIDPDREPPGPTLITGVFPNGAPGDPMVITGTVYKADGKTPAEGMTLFVYHTGADGLYNHNGDVFQPRLYAYMKTGKDGRYEFRTIKPGRYPDHSEPAHIHVHVFGPGYAERFLPEYWFEGDPGLSPADIAKNKDAGAFSAIVHLTRGSDGVWYGVRNLRLP